MEEIHYTLTGKLAEIIFMYSIKKFKRLHATESNRADHLPKDYEFAILDFRALVGRRLLVVQQGRLRAI